MSTIDSLAQKLTQLRDEKMDSFGWSEGSLAAIGREIASFLEPGSLLADDRIEPDPKERRKIPLWSAEDGSFTILATIWAPKQNTPIHDHEYWDVSGMIAGVLLETHYEADPAIGDVAIPRRSVYHHPGDVWSVSPQRPNIHTLVNPTSEIAVALNVHGTGATNFERNTSRVFRLDGRFDHD